MLGSDEELIADLARKAGPGDPGRNRPHRHRLGQEPEVGQLGQVDIHVALEDLARAGALELDVGQLVDD